MDSLIQWNCRGLRANFNELLLLIQNHNPVAVALQELAISDSYKFQNRQYSLFSSLPPSSTRPHGGAGILVRNNVPHRALASNTGLQAVACRISTTQPITLCSIYLPPLSNWNDTDLLNLVTQLPPPVLLLGDFNAHNTLWGCASTDQKGQRIADFLLANNMCLLNSKLPTYIHPATGSRSSIDLALCDPTLFLDYSWNVHDDLCGSDHFPIILNPLNASPTPETQRWKLDKADWDSFSELCSTDIVFEDIIHNANPIESFTDILIKIAGKTIPKTSKKPKIIRKPWFDDDCKNAISERKEALKRFKLNPCSTTLSNLRVFRAKARRTIRSNKRNTWKTYVSRLNSQTPMKKIWSMVRRISGKPSPMITSHLKVNGINIEQPVEIANSIASTISYNSSSGHYSERFRRFKAHQEKRPIDFSSDNSEPYNLPFSRSELHSALKKAHDSAAGPDNIHYQMLKHMPESAVETLLEIFNSIWLTGEFPTSWSEATIIPIPKPGKDPTEPGNYRPIALTSCICKTLERIINDRLVWFLEKNKLLTQYQSGFRKQRSTTDQLVRFETFVREGFVRREHVVSVFFDLEKAYDTTWKHGILHDLHMCGLRGRLPEFISNFLASRHFRVRIGSCLSELHVQEAGVPQGSILSVTLFILKINSIVKCLPPNIRCSLFVDDFLICYRSKNMNSIERLLQLCLNNIQKWADENGFQFSKTKTVCMHFCQQRILHTDPELKIDEVPIPVVEECKFLGLIFDRKLNFISHIKFLKDRCMKALNLLKVVAHRDWGADCTTLLKLYRSHIRSKLDYGCIVYGSARESYLKSLDRVQNAALRICLGAFRTSPIPSLHVEANELPLCLRREKLSLQYVTKLRSNPENPTYQCVLEPSFVLLFEARPSVIPSLGIRIKQQMADTGIKWDCIAKFEFSPIPPWILKPPAFIFDVHTIGSKSEVTPEIFQSKVNEILATYDGFQRIYTDGSKAGTAVSAAAISGPRLSLKRLPDNSSIFSAEARAILLSLNIVRFSANDRFLILSDSLSCLQSIENQKLNHPSILEIIIHIHQLIVDGKQLVFMWLPSHTGLAGNVSADAAAKAALNLPESQIPVAYSDFYPLINNHICSSWQQQWNTETNNKLHSIEQDVKGAKTYHLPRRDECIIHRLRIGHTHFTHAFLLRNEDPPECIACQLPLTVEHILLNCVDFMFIRNKYFTCTTLAELFSSVPSRTIVDFIKEIGLYHKI